MQIMVAPAQKSRKMSTMNVFLTILKHLALADLNLMASSSIIQAWISPTQAFAIG